ncbi:putative aldouronate transport system permease protein [Kribbella aluminosa]|uniref:Aldouronate transport system permease protein n=1 Tax=Kribbella aluminosa TaxID=416017 RepID=A0ABS4UJL1_9ACTN|nr:ABC transporter permease subunit [Kribbella aluminosa]MBP2351841.1 putative aldouronate transport system permease protein [Kribbella aluminosa]
MSTAPAPPRTHDTTERRPPSPPAPRRRTWWDRLKRDKFVLLLALPGMAVIITFHYYPLLGNVIAFQDYQPYLGIRESLWSGFDNFSILFNGDPDLLNALKNTLTITALQTIFVFPAPIVLALILNSLASNRLRQVVQSVLYLPHFLSWVIVVAVFQQMLGGAGLLNNYLRSSGHQALNIIGNADAFKALVTSQVIWKDTGWATILFLAVLAQIDRSLYEAASVDGASKLRQTWHITLPGMRPIIVLLFILKLGDSLSVGFEQILLQQPAVGRQASEVLDTFVYNNGVIGGAWGVAAAVGLVKGVIGLLLVLMANKVAHAFGEEGVYKA